MVGRHTETKRAAHMTGLWDALILVALIAGTLWVANRVGP